MKHQVVFVCNSTMETIVFMLAKLVSGRTVHTRVGDALLGVHRVKAAENGWRPSLLLTVHTEPVQARCVVAVIAENTQLNQGVLDLRAEGTIPRTSNRRQAMNPRPPNTPMSSECQPF
jgi:hypothetical protein